MIVCLVLTFFIFPVVYVLIISKSAWWWLNSFSTPGTCHFLEKKTLKEKDASSLSLYFNFQVTEALEKAV